MAKFLLQVENEQPMLIMSYARRLSLSYSRIPSRDAIAKLSRPSKCQTCLCKNGSEIAHAAFVFTYWGMHWHLGSNPPPLKSKIQNFFIFQCRTSNNAWLRALMQSDCLYSSLFFEHYHRILLCDWVLGRYSVCWRTCVCHNTFLLHLALTRVRLSVLFWV